MFLLIWFAHKGSTGNAGLEPHHNWMGLIVLNKLYLYAIFLKCFFIIRFKKITAIITKNSWLKNQ